MTTAFKGQELASLDFPFSCMKKERENIHRPLVDSSKGFQSGCK